LKWNSTAILDLLFDHFSSLNHYFEKIFQIWVDIHKTFYTNS